MSEQKNLEANGDNEIILMEKAHIIISNFDIQKDQLKNSFDFKSIIEIKDNTYPNLQNALYSLVIDGYSLYCFEGLNILLKTKPNLLDNFSEEQIINFACLAYDLLKKYEECASKTEKSPTGYAQKSLAAFISHTNEDLINSCHKELNISEISSFSLSSTNKYISHSDEVIDTITTPLQIQKNILDQATKFIQFVRQQDLAKKIAFSKLLISNFDNYLTAEPLIKIIMDNKNFQKPFADAINNSKLTINELIRLAEDVCNNSESPIAAIILHNISIADTSPFIIPFLDSYSKADEQIQKRINEKMTVSKFLFKKTNLNFPIKNLANLFRICNTDPLNELINKLIPFSDQQYFDLLLQIIEANSPFISDSKEHKFLTTFVDCYLQKASKLPSFFLTQHSGEQLKNTFEKMQLVNEFYEGGMQQFLNDHTINDQFINLFNLFSRAKIEEFFQLDNLHKEGSHFDIKDLFVFCSFENYLINLCELDFSGSELFTEQNKNIMENFSLFSLHLGPYQKNFLYNQEDNKEAILPILAEIFFTDKNLGLFRSAFNKSLEKFFYSAGKEDFYPFIDAYLCLDTTSIKSTIAYWILIHIINMVDISPEKLFCDIIKYSNEIHLNKEYSEYMAAISTSLIDKILKGKLSEQQICSEINGLPETKQKEIIVQYCSYGEFSQKQLSDTYIDNMFREDTQYKKFYNSILWLRLKGKNDDEKKSFVFNYLIRGNLIDDLPGAFFSSQLPEHALLINVLNDITNTLTNSQTAPKFLKQIADALSKNNKIVDNLDTRILNLLDENQKDFIRHCLTTTTPNKVSFLSQKTTIDKNSLAMFFAKELVLNNSEIKSTLFADVLKNNKNYINTFLQYYIVYGGRLDNIPPDILDKYQRISFGNNLSIPLNSTFDAPSNSPSYIEISNFVKFLTSVHSENLPPFDDQLFVLIEMAGIKMDTFIKLYIESYNGPENRLPQSIRDLEITKQAIAERTQAQQKAKTQSQTK